VICELRIENLGVIASACVRPGTGFTALTGETGAGKTMVLSALEMLLGGRVDAAIAQSASVEGVWEVPAHHRVVAAVQEAGGAADDGEVLLARSASNGRLRAFAGGRMVPASLLAQIGEQLVTVHGQSSQQRLRHPAAQRAALDRSGGQDHLSRLQHYRQAYVDWQQVAAALQTARTGLQQTQQRMLFLQSALEEIEKVDPQPGETSRVQAEHHRLANLADIMAATTSAGVAIHGDEGSSTTGAADLLHGAARDVSAVADTDPELAALYDRLLVAAEEVTDIGRELRTYASALIDEPGRLEWLNQRLHALGVLHSRYGRTDDEVLQWAQQAAAELVALERDSDLEVLTAREHAAREAVDEAADALSRSRRALAADLAERATEELRQLAMPNAALSVDVSATELGPDGADEVTYLLLPHPGATAAPISKSASGGELSRIMLALEVVLAATDSVPTFVFDEVDAGVGGAAATAIGRRLALLAEHAQVIVVTHMPQVAAFADTHLRVLKQQDQHVTVSDVRALDPEERVVEIARMLAGQEESEAAQEHARELLALPVRG
jgi:DNA repair protein RecN (Recombination protein N)